MVTLLKMMIMVIEEKANDSDNDDDSDGNECILHRTDSIWFFHCVWICQLCTVFVLFFFLYWSVLLSKISGYDTFFVSQSSSSMKFDTVAKVVHGAQTKASGLKMVANVKSAGNKWMEYTTQRRLRRKTGMWSSVFDRVMIFSLWWECLIRIYSRCVCTCNFVFFNIFVISILLVRMLPMSWV